MNICPLEAKCVSADPISEKYVLKSSIDKVYAFLRDPGDRSKFLLLKDDREIARIVLGSSWSGSLWVSDDCIGEYALINGQYSVLPYENGHKQHGRKENIHPLDYLIRLLH